MITPNFGGRGEDTRAEVAPLVATPVAHHLLVFHNGASWMHPLPADGSLVIGRSDHADLRIDDDSVSRQHARVTVKGNVITIADLGSHNGTFVNRERVTGQRQLVPGDTISIVNATLIVHYLSAAPPPPTVLDAEQFRQRLDDELERSLRYDRSFTVVVLKWPSPVTDVDEVDHVLTAQLRRIDAATWVNLTTMYVLLAEAAGTEASAFIARIRRYLDPGVRVGHASCPSDGADIDQLLASAASAAAGAALGQTTHNAISYQTVTIGSQRIIIADPAVYRLYALIERLARASLPVLVHGETGTGKELAATAIHARSPRRNRPMISLNCAAIAETLIESELFGHEKGAFSGASATKVGYIEAADGSTLFLDEIGELTLAAQAKLLRVLETRRFTRVGETRERESDVRIVAATHRDLEADVESGRFRQDLYFRLCGAVLHVPPLRERPRELPHLARSFLADACKRAERDPMTISDEAMELLLAHGWPGNVRELKNLMEYAAAAHPEAVLT
ncbi:MAG: FHA domain-containing protein, partial [Kofleriaceae bacterium]